MLSQPTDEVLDESVGRVQRTVPLVYAGRFLTRSSVDKFAASSRWFSLAISLLCLGLLITAAGLPPAANGYGTHRQLGMVECGFLARTNLPCPACGMTTSFAWFARGNVPASFYIQPMGCALALICAMTFWAGMYSALAGQPLHRMLAIIPEKIYLIPLFVLAMLAWAWKMYIHLHGIDGWT